MTTSIAFWSMLLLATLTYQMGPGYLFFLAAFPGTLAHELAHYFTALVMKGRPHPINMVPKKDGNIWTLGSVVFYPTWWNGSFVALAPLLLMPVAYGMAVHANNVETTAQLWLGYLAGCFLNSSIPSPADWDIAARFPFGLTLLALVGAMIWRFH